MNVTEQNRLVAAGVDVVKPRVDMTPCDHGQTVGTCVLCNGRDQRDREQRAQNSRAAFLRFKFAMKRLHDQQDLLARQLPTSRSIHDQRLYTR